MATIFRKGLPFEVDDQIVLWRKRKRRFEAQRKELLNILLDKFGTSAKVEAWLLSPHPDLGGAKPRQFINPRQIKGLLKYIKSNVSKS